MLGETCQVTALHGCHMHNKQVVSVVVSVATCFIDFCSTGKSIRIDNAPVGLLFFGHIYPKRLFPWEKKDKVESFILYM